MSFVLFAFLLLFECIKPFGIGLFARTAPALAHLLVLLPAAPVWDCGVQALRQSQQPD